MNSDLRGTGQYSCLSVAATRITTESLQRLPDVASSPAESADGDDVLTESACQRVLAARSGFCGWIGQAEVFVDKAFAIAFRLNVLHQRI